MGEYLIYVYEWSWKMVVDRDKHSIRNLDFYGLLRFLL